jgi:hypothetical protein
MTDTRPLVAVDWSVHRIHYTFDGVSVATAVDLGELLTQLTVAHRIVVESTFESWDPARRTGFIRDARAAGHELYAYRPIHTARRRPEGMKKTDANDALVIHMIASSSNLHLYKLPELDEDWSAFRVAANREYALLRLAGGKDELTTAAKAILGPYGTLDADARTVLGNGKTYSPSLTAAVYFAATKAPTRAEFERLLGLHGSAHPSLLRSEIHHHSFRHARKRGVTWQQFRRELRRAYRRIRTHLDALES